MMFCKTKHATERGRESIAKIIERKLFLKVNKEKTVVSYIKGVKYTLQGVKVEHPTKGVYIRNGKKVVVK